MKLERCSLFKSLKRLNKMIKILLFAIVSIFSFASLAQEKFPSAQEKAIWDRLDSCKSATFSIDSLALDSGKLQVFLHPSLCKKPLREYSIVSIQHLIKSCLDDSLSDRTIQLYVKDKPLTYYIPNYYRRQLAPDTARKIPDHSKTIIRKLDKEPYQLGLSGKNIALWASHGWYYEAKLDRWEWQRARCFSTVEDLSSPSYIHAYLAPMLENAGATVHMPRERDIQEELVIVDNDGKTQGKIHKKGRWKKAGSGYKHRCILYDNQNPFQEGTFLRNTVKKGKQSYIQYIPDVPKSGEYSVYVSWGNDGAKAGKARYEVYHTGGVSSFEVDQQTDGKNWYYLGTFNFKAGKNKEKGAIKISNAPGNPAGCYISSDAIRLGAGKGRVARGGKEARHTSGVLSYQEGARYYLQASGFPDTVYSPENFKNDYRDDYRCRGLWVNYLLHERHIPIDLSLAFHTDAGITPDSSIIGTLGIYSTTMAPTFGNGASRSACRDLTDLIQTQVTEDIRRQYNVQWTRRDMWDQAYNEAWKPDVPAMLIELLSHQNLADMRYSLDPRFRFSVCRAIYKGILHYLSSNTDIPYVVQPLPPINFKIELLQGKKIRLSWEGQIDTLEPTATPTSFRLYMKKGRNGFDNGLLIQGNSCEIELPEWGQPYHFRITGVNAGGESFPSETLSACLFADSRKPALIVNGFTRISAPRFFDNKEMGGIAWWEDEGVADGKDIHFIGYQYDFDRRSPWLDDDCPGWGACDTQGRNKIVYGNTFDFPSIHGEAFRANGYSYVSCSRGAFEKDDFNLRNYCVVDMIMGEQRTTANFLNPQKNNFEVYTPAMMQQLTRLHDLRIPLFLSGAYVGTDITENRDTVAYKFACDVLHYVGMNNISSRNGKIYPTNAAIENGFQHSFAFNTGAQEGIYRVEAPDAIEPKGENGIRIFRYQDSNMNAGTAWNGEQKNVILGFPFETVLEETTRTQLLKEILDFLLKSEINTFEHTK